MSSQSDTVATLHAENSVVSACREWLNIVCFRILSETRVTSTMKPLDIRAAVAERHEMESFPGQPEVVIRGTVHHSRLPGDVKFQWLTTLTDTKTFRMLGRSVGHGTVEYIGRKIHFMLERSDRDVLWVRLCTSRGEPTSMRFSAGRGKMKPRTIDMTVHKH